MKASKQRKMMKAIVSNKGLHQREAVRITKAQSIAAEQRMLRTAKMLDKQLREFAESRRGLAGWALVGWA